MDRSKYNVAKDTAGRTCNGIVFDSAIEMRYYKEVVLPGVESGDIAHYELQKEYILQPKFIKDGKTIQPIKYKADFYIEYADGHTEVIDTKGCPDAKAMIKRKMFWYLFPALELRWLVYTKKWGGWLDYDKVNELRRNAKKEKQKEIEKNGEE